MEEKKREKLPIDAKLLSDAIIELNISRRSVGLYPREHPITRESLEKAFAFLKQLFELRSSITIGIAKDTLIVDEYTLERKNPVFREFALSVHQKGIASITFYAGLEIDELYGLHEMITSRDFSAGKDLLEDARGKGLTHISLSPLDMSSFGFVEDSLREVASGTNIWEDYVYGLIEGKLAGAEAERVLLAMPPEEMAGFFDGRMREDAPEKTYDRVITSYLRKKEDSGIRGELFTRFVSMVDRLSPALKQQFLRRAFNYDLMDAAETEKVLSDLTRDDIEKVMKVFSEHASLIPESLRNVVDKLASSKKGHGFFDLLVNEKAIVDDVEIDEGMVGLFAEDKFRTFVADSYQEELERMLGGVEVRLSPMREEIERGCREEMVDGVVSEVMLELLDEDSVNREEFLALLTKLSELVDSFLDTGRFEEICTIYNTLYSLTLTGRFRDETTAMIGYSFSSEVSVARIVDAFRTWGRFDREGVMRLARVLKKYMNEPLLDALSEEADPAVRKFFLFVLSGFRSDVVPEALRRLNDSRWYVVRNMIYLLRECGGVKYMKQVKALAKHADRRIAFEAVKTLLHFNVPGAFSYVRIYLQSKDLDVRDQAIRLVGTYRVKEAVPYLIGILERRGLFGAEWYYKVAAVRALGEIRDPGALYTLARLARAKSLLFKGPVEKLKIEIFRSLENYPFASVRPLLEAGLTSGNKEIRAICEQMLKDGGNGSVSGKDK